MFGVVVGLLFMFSRVGILLVLKIGCDLYVIDCGLGLLNVFINVGL